MKSVLPLFSGAVIATAALAMMTAFPLGVFAAPQFDLGPQRARELPHFYADATFFPSSGQGGILEVHYDISYSQLQFLKVPDGFRAGFEVQVLIYGGKGKQVGGDSWRRQVLCSSYKETISPAGSYEETFKLETAFGKYDLVVRTENLDSDEVSSIEMKLDLRQFSTFPAISDLLIGKCKAESADSGSLRSRLVPFPRATFGERIPTVCVYGEIYDTLSRTGSAATSIQWQVRDERGAVKIKDTLDVPISGRVSPFLFTFPVDNLAMGEHRLELFVGKRTKTPNAARTFRVDESKFDLEKNIDDTLTLLSYIAPRSEVEAIKKATGDERKRLWLQFWKKRDPYPETPENEFLIEFFDRVRYANENFSSTQPGWKTDRGRIYIRRGPPDQVETRPFSAEGPAYEVWYYFQPNLTFVFVDRMGLGDYELVGSTRE